MNQKAKAIQTELARARAYFHRHEVDRALASFALALKNFCVASSVVGQTRLNIAGMVHEIALALSRSDEVKAVKSGGFVYKRGSEKQLLMDVLKVIKAGQKDEGESREAERERKLKIDRLLLRGQRQLDHKKLADAEEAFKEATALYVDEHKLFYFIGQKLVDAGFHRQALKYLQQGLKILPGDLKAYWAAADVYVAMDDLEKAEGMLLNAHKNAQPDGETYLRLARIFETRGKLKQAYAAGKKAVEFDPLLMPAHKLLKRIKKKAQAAQAGK